MAGLFPRVSMFNFLPGTRVKCVGFVWFITFRRDKECFEECRCTVFDRKTFVDAINVNHIFTIRTGPLNKK